MEEIRHIGILIAMLVGFTACMLIDTPPTSDIILQDSVQCTTTSVQIKGSIESASTVTELQLLLSTSNNVHNATYYNIPMMEGKFEYQINNLSENNTYYYQYVYKNALSQALSEIKSFTTLAYTMPVVETCSVDLQVADRPTITCKGRIISNGGINITKYGFCYGWYEQPTIEYDNCIQGKMIFSTDSFEATFAIPVGETYYVRAYAKNNKGVGYGQEMKIKALKKPQEGAIPKAFSISANKQVYFSKGNLQYNSYTNTWQFSEHQWDVIGMGYELTDDSLCSYVGGNVNGSDNRKIGKSDYTGWIDLFGWGTGNNPTLSSTDYLNDYTTFVDWGDNAISNGGNQRYLWRTLTCAEWLYVLNERTDATVKRAAASVNGMNGLILLPDNWVLPAGCSLNIGYASSAGYKYWGRKNTISLEKWEQLEAAGAVFLPAAGGRWYGTQIWEVGNTGFYQFSSPATLTSCSIYMCANFSGKGGSDNLSDGRSVRLVQDAQ